MPVDTALLASQLVVRVCLFLVAAIAMFGGTVLAGVGRVVSIRKVGLPKPAAVWLGYLVPELVLPFVIAGAQYAGQ
jgi:hypothetical protein